ncbi:primosomal replication protein [Catenovulum sp. 2E275]|uniref:primosomal replication protein n=1 Tax=Catenovulum sp. 2E275 TaxID=2980497 RepID=UPI0021CF3BF7|nr:primosomal replication protein [Catenovulum sp. 2E275]MCU4676724.1 primosomal replication protein [Catenovulum sp. 2E275]
MTLQQQVEQTLSKLTERLKQNPDQEKLVSILQSHTSFICQAETLDDYLEETKRLIDLAFNKTTQNDERLADRLNDQLELLAKLALNQKLIDINAATEYKSRVGKMHQTLAQYRQYLAQFDDQIRLNPNLPAEHSIFKRRERCLSAILQLEEKISKIEQKGYGTNRFI